MRTISLTAIAFTLTSNLLCAQSLQPLNGTFSNLSVSKQSGDINGYEIVAIPQSQGVMIVFQCAEGAPSSPVLVPIHEEGSKFSFTVQDQGNACNGSYVGSRTPSGLTLQSTSGKQLQTLFRQQSYWTNSVVPPNLNRPTSATISKISNSSPRDIPPTELQAMLDLPLDQAVKQRLVHKAPLKAAYAHQVALAHNDCLVEKEQGQQPYNICMGHAEEQADMDFAIFYNNLQMLCHDQDELSAMQALERSWRSYHESGMKAASASWPGGTGAPAFASQIDLSLIRGHMSELNDIYGLNISQ